MMTFQVIQNSFSFSCCQLIVELTQKKLMFALRLIRHCTIKILNFQTVLETTIKATAFVVVIENSENKQVLIIFQITRLKRKISSSRYNVNFRLIQIIHFCIIIIILILFQYY